MGLTDGDVLRLGLQVDGVGNVQAAMGAAGASVETMAVRTEAASVEAGEALTLLKERMLSVAEGAHVASAGVGSAFGALSGLLGAGIAFEFLNHLKESTLQLGHLAEASGLTVEQLVELKDSMQAMGASTERLPIQITKLSQNIAAAGDGSKQAQHNFHELGIETDTWSKQLPGTIDVLLQMAHHLKDSDNNTQNLASASKLLGRNTFETVAFLKQGDEAIRAQMKSHEEHARAVAASVASAKELQRTEANLSQELQTVLLPAFRYLVTGIELFIGGLMKVKGVGEATIAFLGHMGEAAVSVGKVLSAAMDPDMWLHPSKMVGSINEMRATVSKSLQEGASEWGEILTKTDANIDKLFVPVEAAAKGTDSEIVKDASKAAKSRLDVWRDALVQMKLAEDAFHDSGAAGDLKYWQDIEANNTLGKSEILAVHNEILRAKKQVAKEELQSKIDELNLEIDADKKNLPLKVANLQKEVELYKQTYGEKSHQFAVAKQKVEEAQAEENANIAKKLKEQQKMFQELGAAKAEAEVSAAHDTLEQQKATLDYEVTLGSISALDRLKMLQDYEKQAYAAEYSALTKKIALYDKDTKAYANAMKEREKLDADYATKSIGLERQLALQKIQPIMNFFKSVGQNFKTSLNGWLQGTQTFGQAMKGLWNSVLLSAAQSIEEIGLKWFEEHVFMKMVSALFHVEESTQQATADATQVGLHAAKNEAMVVSDSGLAAANAYAPLAEFPPAATAAALAAEAATMAFGAPAAFEMGGVVPRTGLVLAHEGEPVVDRRWKRTLEQLATGGGQKSINLTYAPVVKAFDPRDAAAIIQQQAHEAGRVAKRSVMKHLRKTL